MHIVDVQYMYVGCYKWTIINTCIINIVQVILCTVYMYTCSWDKKTVVHRNHVSAVTSQCLALLGRASLIKIYTRESRLKKVYVCDK